MAPLPTHYVQYIPFIQAAYVPVQPAVQHAGYNDYWMSTFAITNHHHWVYALAIYEAATGLEGSILLASANAMVLGIVHVAPIRGCLTSEGT